MPTVVESTIGTGGAYPDIATWYASIPADLVAADQIHRGLLKKQKHTGGAVLAAKTTSANCYIELTTEAGASWLDDASAATNPLRYDATKGAAVESSASSTATLTCNSKFMRVSKIQFSNTSTNGAPAFIGGNDDSIFEDLIIEGACANSALKGAARFYGARSIGRRIAIIQKRADATAIIASATYGFKFEQSTLVSLGAKLNAGVETSGVAGVIENTAVMNVTAPESGNVVATKVNAYTDATAAGWSATPFDTSNFRNITAGSHDLRLTVGGPLDVANAGVQPPAAPDTTAPNLSNPTATATSSTALTGTVATDEGGGLLYYLASGNATETEATMLASGATQTVTATGQQVVNVTGQTPGASRRLHYMHADAAGNKSAVVSSSAVTLPAPDTVAPTFAQGAAITPGTVTTSSISGSYPAASDNVGVAGYQKSKDSGATWEDNGAGLTFSFSALPSGTTFPVWVRAYDNGSPPNYSTPLQTTMATTAAATGSFKSSPMVNDTLSAWPEGTAINWEWHQGGRIGSAPTSITRGTGTLAADRTLTVTGCPLGAGLLLASKRGANVAADDVYCEVGTVA